MDNFKKSFCFDPPKQHTTMTPEYKTELNTTELCNANDKSQYRQCIGDMKWAISLGRIYIMYANIAI